MQLFPVWCYILELRQISFYEGLFGLRCWTLIFNSYHRFSIGFKSIPIDGHGSSVSRFLRSQTIEVLDLKCHCHVGRYTVRFPVPPDKKQPLNIFGTPPCLTVGWYRILRQESLSFPTLKILCTSFCPKRFIVFFCPSIHNTHSQKLFSLSKRTLANFKQAAA